jgi:Integrase core domain
MKLGIVHERIQPGRPQQNGRHERMHRTLKENVLNPPAATLRAQQSRFDRFRYVFNNERPHPGTCMNFIGLDIHKKTISYCVKDISGKVLSEGKIPATRQALQEWVGTLGKPWTVAMEATMLTGWI